tara:strand:- start:2334 stop:3059 length:726 start_codon:yes stop_codon:yes gene_type:complete
MILLILASGRGTRLKYKTKNKPKCLININGKPILSYQEEFINKFNKIIIVAGYKSSKVKRFFKDKKVKFILNKNYKSSNMVESIFCARKHINDDVVIIYSDIIFEFSIINLLKKKITTMPVKRNWYQVWKKRMDKKKIKKDAENIEIRNGKLISIGGKIINKIPKYQFMGILKVVKKDFKIMKDYYYKLNNKKIDLTRFINYYLKESKKNIFCPNTNKFWFEIDTLRDLKAVNNILKKRKW